jgi:acyl-coenzyme A thioesterase PaaI-like protein
MKRAIFRLLNIYPPYLGAGIRVRHLAPDVSSIEMEMKLRPWNKNAVGTHFGGSLYSMCDPIYMLMLLHALGDDYIVWDKAATIRFLRPGRGTVRARFELSPERARAIAEEADKNGKTKPTFTVQVKDAAGEVVAEVEKVLYVRRKDRKA